MDDTAYGKWLEAIDDLAAGQRAEVRAILDGRSSETEVIAALEGRLVAERVCPRCGAVGLVCRGRASGLRRLYCRGCGRTCNALTGTSLAHLHRKERWLEFARSLGEGETVRQSARRCAVAASTAFFWRHRFLRAIRTDAEPLNGIVEADETWVLESQKGSRAWRRAPEFMSRKPRRRGGSAGRRGLSREQVPVLVAVDRSGATLSAVLPAATAKAIGHVLAPVLSRDARLVTDAARPYPSCAAALGVTHEVLGRSAGQRVRGDLHIQTVNSRHERLKSFLRRYRGIATSYLASYLKWFHLAVLRPDPTPRACLNAAMGWR